MTSINSEFEDVTPDPVELIKSIAEQGYRLETAIADLIDNSISADADKVEVLLDTNIQPFTMFIADNGSGMTEEELKSAMRFPSSSMEEIRGKNDLGRFGLGLKTASFSQSRCFSVISRKHEIQEFRGRTWDVALLRERGWTLKKDNADEIEGQLSHYKSTSKSLLGEFDESFSPRTIVIWRGLYKFEDYIEEHDRAEILKTELTEITRGHLSLVFHRFMERSEKPLQIRLNNILCKPFDPFPSDQAGTRRLQLRNRQFGEDAISVEGFVLPTASIDEVKRRSSKWTPPGKTLMDMEGIYIYRANRIILSGGWLGLTGRSQRMQLARMRVEIGNAVDHLLHLNIAKSQVEMPHDLRAAFRKYIAELKREAEREYYNRTIKSFDARSDTPTEPFIKTYRTNRGVEMRINPDFPLVKDLTASLAEEGKTRLKAILRMFNTELNRIRRVHEDSVFTGVEEDDGLTRSELMDIVIKLLEERFEPNFIKSNVIERLGYQADSLPEDVSKLLNGKD